MILNKNQIIGGEQDLLDSTINYYTTNSGRSSLRWILLSLDKNKIKNILVPNFLCQIVIDIIKEFNYDISFYHVNEKLEIELPQDVNNYDIIYVVKYFNIKIESMLKNIDLIKKTIIVDDVFSITPEVMNIDSAWYSYNSLRKISNISDISFIASNVCLVEINKKSLDVFSSLKYKGKDKKFKYINYQIGNEKEYLELFDESEEILNKSKDIYFPSDKSIYLSNEFNRNFHIIKKIRINNLNYINKKINKNILLKIDTDFPSFQPILINNRDNILSLLRTKNIFLAVHWPHLEDIKNDISDKILSIPVDQRYSYKDLDLIITILNESYEKLKEE